ncbi:MAG TPA: redoxin domain-containing protein, partial [Nitrosomonas sp.]|nr:redoxin domain-containing protein [Nitrosomonas sp.]
MEELTIILAVVTLGFMFWYFSRPTVSLKVGQYAPDFHLPDQHGKTYSLIDFRGQWLALYFYPKDD